MPLQYRDDDDRLLLVDGTDSLAGECCCEDCTGDGNWKFDACCDGTSYDDQKLVPKYVVLSDAKYTALGDPSCIIYNECCYCDPEATDKCQNVNPDDVVASVEINCVNCRPTQPDCIGCVDCNSCVPTLKTVYRVTFNITCNDGSTFGYGIDPWDGKSAQAQQEINGQYFDVPYISKCVWTDFTNLEYLQTIFIRWDAAKTLWGVSTLLVGPAQGGLFRKNPVNDPSDPVILDDPCEPVGTYSVQLPQFNPWLIPFLEGGTVIVSEI